MSKLVLVRHGESQWNQENRFTGWVDVDLSEKGIIEAKEAGETLKNSGLLFDTTYTSVLKRAIRTHWIITEAMDKLWLPVTRSWRLNERHYGALQGLNKTEMALKHGEDQVKIWRRSFDVPPPALSYDDPQHPRFDLRYHDVAPHILPSGESLLLTIQRMAPLWNEQIKPQLMAGKNVLIVAHGNSLRAIIQTLENMSSEAILELNVPTGIPLLYELDSQLNVTQKQYLGDQQKIAERIAQVAAQGKTK